MDKADEKPKRVKPTTAWRDNKTGKVFFLQGIPRKGWTKWEVWAWDKQRRQWESIKTWPHKVEQRKAREWLEEYAKEHFLEALYESEIHQ